MSDDLGFPPDAPPRLVSFSIRSGGGRWVQAGSIGMYGSGARGRDVWRTITREIAQEGKTLGHDLTWSSASPLAIGRSCFRFDYAKVDRLQIYGAKGQTLADFMDTVVESARTVEPVRDVSLQPLCLSRHLDRDVRETLRRSLNRLHPGGRFGQLGSHGLLQQNEELSIWAGEHTGVPVAPEGEAEHSDVTIETAVLVTRGRRQPAQILGLFGLTGTLPQHSGRPPAPPPTPPGFEDQYLVLGSWVNGGVSSDVPTNELVDAVPSFTDLIDVARSLQSMGVAEPLVLSEQMVHALSVQDGSPAYINFETGETIDDFGFRLYNIPRTSEAIATVLEWPLLQGVDFRQDAQRLRRALSALSSSADEFPEAEGPPTPGRGKQPLPPQFEFSRPEVEDAATRTVAEVVERMRAVANPLARVAMMDELSRTLMPDVYQEGMDAAAEFMAAEGTTWRHIGEALGVTAAAAQQRLDPELRRRANTRKR